VHILMLCSDFGIPLYGHKGASVHLRAMAQAFMNLGHAVCVVSPQVEASGNADFKVPVHALPLTREQQDLVADLRKLDRHLGNLGTEHPARLAQEVRNLLYNHTLGGAVEALRTLQPDVLYERYTLFGFGGIELARTLEVPHVLEVNAPLVREHEGARGLHLKAMAQALERRVWSSTDALLVVSDALRREALASGVSEERIHVVPNGVDPSVFSMDSTARDRVRARLGLGTGPVIGFVGSLKPWHGTELLLQAFVRAQRNHPEARLLIVGDGPQRQALQAETDAAGVRDSVCFTGAVDHAQVPETMAAMDIATAPYLPQEDFYFSPIKVYEAMVLGLPVVASRIGQIQELVDAGLVLGAAPGNLESWVAALETVLEDPGMATRVAAKGRDWASRERTWVANARRVTSLAASLRSS